MKAIIFIRNMESDNKNLAGNNMLISFSWFSTKDVQSNVDQVSVDMSGVSNPGQLRAAIETAIRIRIEAQSGQIVTNLINY